MSELTELKQVIDRELAKTDYKGTSNVETSLDPYSAQVNLQTHQMDFGFNLSRQEQPTTRRVVARDLPWHEYGHIGGELETGDKVLGIPGDVETSETYFFSPIYDVLSKKKFSAEDADYVENCLEDTLLHLEGSSRRSWTGIRRFFQLQDFSDFYEAHVKLNMLLWGSAEQKDAMREKYKGSEKASKALAGFLKRTNTISNGMKSQEELRTFFLNPNNWQEISKIYAEEFSSLMTPNYARPAPNHNGAGTKGREKEDSSKQGNVFQRQRKKEEYKRGRARKSFDNGEALPAYMTKTDEQKVESYDLLYDDLVNTLEIRAESETVQDSLPIATLVSKEFDPLTDFDTDSVVGLNDAGRPALYIPRKRLELPQQIKVGSRGFPKIKYVQLDTSSSMQDGIDARGAGNSATFNGEWGDNSKYHFSLLAWKGFVKYLILNGLLVDANSIELDNFSTKTLTGSGLDAARRVAFLPQWQNTYLNEGRVKQIFDGEGNLVFTISDGEITNWGDVRGDFLQGAKKNHYFHFQIGGHSTASRDMKQEGLQVELCRGHKDLASRVIDLTRTIRTSDSL
jgi:hypothetical protein